MKNLLTKLNHRQCRASSLIELALLHVLLNLLLLLLRLVSQACDTERQCSVPEDGNRSDGREHS